MTKPNINVPERWYLLKLLHDHTMSITFTKKDGSERVMRCTLQEEFLPERKVTEGKETKPKKENLDIIPAFDLDKNAWRSIRVESITDMEYAS